MYVLDTDVFSYYFVRDSANECLRHNIESTPYERLWITTITIEEALHGVIKLVETYEKSTVEEEKAKIVFAYSLFPDVLEAINKPQTLAFDNAAYVEYLNLPSELTRNKERDCRIACVAVSRNYTLVTNNSRHFPEIQRAFNVATERLRVQYWMKEARS